RAALAQVVDFWDFSCTPLSYDSRYFYDASHFRNAVGSMVLAEIFGNDEVYRPEDFGTYVTAENCGAYLDKPAASAPDPADYTAEVPVLMYHHFSETETGDIVVRPETFALHMQTLRDAGYQAVTVQEMIDYVYDGAPLPDKPVCITMDDGYLSNYETALPILEEYSMKATVFAIGSSVGHDRFYKDTDHPLTPHFGYDEAREMQDSGVLDFQSHTYDMHQWAPFETGDVIRASALPLEGESEAGYAEALFADMERYEQERRRELGAGFQALAYPGGYYDDLTEVLIHQAGIPVTFSIRTDARNVLVRGLPQSLYALCRWNVTERTAPQDLLAMVSGS
ncbi:MAG: polysaccharide deacetylase family protein, partial [Oscillospiraceae bacterium]|nr:polysaccharide deacetylase family protein [Oscillospiraceae bacterium]